MAANISQGIRELQSVFQVFPEILLQYWSADFALIIRAISVLEGIALVGDPEFAIVDEAYPFIAKLLLTDKSPRLQAALRYMASSLFAFCGRRKSTTEGNSFGHICQGLCLESVEFYGCFIDLYSASSIGNMKRIQIRKDHAFGFWDPFHMQRPAGG